MYWDSFTSLFQLIAAFTLTYALIEKFAFGLQRAIQVSNQNLKAICEEYDENGLGHSSKVIHMHNSDFIQARIDSLGEGYRVIYFMAFFSCFFFILFAAFERFYREYINSLTESCDVALNMRIHYNFGGLCLIPFITLLVSLIFFLGNRKIFNKEEILKGYYERVDVKQAKIYLVNNPKINDQYIADRIKKRCIPISLGLTVPILILLFLSNLNPSSYFGVYLPLILISLFVVIIVIIFIFQLIDINSIYSGHRECRQEYEQHAHENEEKSKASVKNLLKKRE